MHFKRTESFRPHLSTKHNSLNASTTKCRQKRGKMRAKKLRKIKRKFGGRKERRGNREAMRQKPTTAKTMSPKKMVAAVTPPSKIFPMRNECRRTHCCRKLVNGATGTHTRVHIIVFDNSIDMYCRSPSLLPSLLSNLGFNL